MKIIPNDPVTASTSRPRPVRPMADPAVRHGLFAQSDNSVRRHQPRSATPPKAFRKAGRRRGHLTVGGALMFMDSPALVWIVGDRIDPPTGGLTSPGGKGPARGQVRQRNRRQAMRPSLSVCPASGGHLSSCPHPRGRRADRRCLLVPGWGRSRRRPARPWPGRKPLLRRVGGRCRVRPMILTGLAHGARHGPVWATEEAAREDPDVGSAAEAGRAPRVSVKISYIADRRDCQGRSPERSRRGESKMLGDSEAIR
jgi:hypothetical protein